MVTNEQYLSPATRRRPTMWKFFVYSAIGAFMFFVPVTIGDTSSIMLDHIVNWFENTVPDALPYYALALILGGALYPFFSGTWRESTVAIIFTAFKVIGLVVGIMLVFGFGPAWLFNEDLGPFLFNALVIPVGVLVPIGAIFLALLVGYGLLEFVGVLLQPVMRPVFRTPGRSAIDAVASFVGSYSLSLLITNRIYKEGRYTAREAAIIASGFSTVSATFMVVVANTLGLMEWWNLYFWSTLAVTFLVTAITVRLWPLSSLSDDRYPGTTEPPPARKEGGQLTRAWAEAQRTVAEAPPVAQNIASNLRDGVKMAMAILPSILSIGLLGLVLAEFTPVFEILGYVFYPITWVLQIPEPLLVAEAAALGISEMFLPAVLVAEEAMAVKFVIGIVSVSQIVFFSALVPSVVATQIPLSVPHMVVIWAERVALSLIIAIPVALIVF